MKLKRIFSGDYSDDMWAAIKESQNVAELRRAVYFVCVRLQELEHRMSYSHDKRKKVRRKSKPKKGHQGGTEAIHS